MTRASNSPPPKNHEIAYASRNLNISNVRLCRVNVYEQVELTQGEYQVKCGYTVHMSDDLAKEFEDKILRNGELIDPSEPKEAEKPHEVDLVEESEHADDFND